MSTKSLTEAFEVKPKIEINNENVKDYEVFGDKGLLESIKYTRRYFTRRLYK